MGVVVMIPSILPPSSSLSSGSSPVGPVSTLPSMAALNEASSKASFAVISVFSLDSMRVATRKLHNPSQRWGSQDFTA